MEFSGAGCEKNNISVYENLRKIDFKLLNKEHLNNSIYFAASIEFEGKKYKYSYKHFSKIDINYIKSEKAKQLIQYHLAWIEFHGEGCKEDRSLFK